MCCRSMPVCKARLFVPMYLRPPSDWRRNWAPSPEQFAFDGGCQLEIEASPEPGPPIAVGLDGGYIRGRERRPGATNCFAVIAGKSIPQEGPARLEQWRREQLPGARHCAILQHHRRCAVHLQRRLCRSTGPHRREYSDWCLHGRSIARHLQNLAGERKTGWQRITRRLDRGNRT